MPAETSQDSTTTGDNRSCFWRYITAITRTWALLTIIGLWALTVQAFREKEKDVYTHWYLLAISPVVTFLEVIWIFNKCACCKYDEGCCCRFWHALLWIDGWKKTVLYVIFSVPCFLKGIVAMWAIIYGVVLLVLAVFYFLKSIGSCCGKKPSSKNDSSQASDDPKSSLVQQEVVPGQSTSTYSATGTTPPPQMGSSSDRPSASRATNPEWPPSGYEVGPDGTLQVVKQEPEVVKPKKREENYKVERETKSDQPEVKKPDQDNFEPVSAPWPPPGFEVGPDGLLRAVKGGKSEQNKARHNPFNSGNR